MSCAGHHQYNNYRVTEPITSFSLKEVQLKSKYLLLIYTLKHNQMFQLYEEILINKLH